MVLWDILMGVFECLHDFLRFLGISLGVLEPSHGLGGFPHGFLRFSHVSMGSYHRFFRAFSSFCRVFAWILGSSHGLWGVPVFLGVSSLIYGIFLWFWGLLMVFSGLMVFWGVVTGFF